MRSLLAAIAALVLLSGPVSAGTAAEDFGTREPATCDDRSQPPTPETAARYFKCQVEGEQFYEMWLVGNVKIQVAPKGRPYNPNNDLLDGVDIDKPVYDIRGSYRQYVCESRSSSAWAEHPGRACAYWDATSAHGACWEDTFADWHCSMTDPKLYDRIAGIAPPND